MIKSLMAETHRSYFEVSPPAQEFSTTLENFVASSRVLSLRSSSSSSSSSSSFNENWEITPLEDSLPWDREDVGWYRRPRGPAVPSSTVFPEVFPSSIQSNPIFQLLVYLKPYLFRSPVGLLSQIPERLLQKLFCIECFTLIRKVIANYLPQMSDLLCSIKETQIAVSPNSIPLDVAYALIEFIEFADRLTCGFRELECFREARSALYKCLIYQGIGEGGHAVEIARVMLVASRSGASEFPDVPAQWPVIRSFMATSLLLQYGHLTEAEESFTILKTRAKFSAPATAALKILSDLKSSLLPPSEVLRQPLESHPIEPDAVLQDHLFTFDDSHIEQIVSLSSQGHTHLPAFQAMEFSAGLTWVPQPLQNPSPSFAAGSPYADIFLPLFGAPEEQKPANDLNF